MEMLDEHGKPLMAGEQVVKGMMVIINPVLHDYITQKKRVEDMFAEEATIDGLEHIECKIFK